jgi:hypothetical protein
MVISILMSHNIALWLTRDEARRITVNSSRAVGLSILEGGASVAGRGSSTDMICGVEISAGPAITNTQLPNLSTAQGRQI